ncbi:MAG TPA: FAD:protein FMN transferase, partial [Solirubrobacteraceae bacterium]|nr:FAD:protein FMN transferase [Solirubrobacteraceae bacterium]
MTEHEHRFRAFATDVRVLVNAATPLDAVRVQALFQRLHRTLTRFDGASELSALNARAGEEVAVSTTLLRAVDAALWAARASAGLVDP